MEKPYFIEVTDDITVCRFSKTPTSDELIGAMNDFVARDLTFRRLWIFQFGIKFSTAELKKLVQYARKIVVLPTKTAIVAPDDLSFGLARMHDVFREQEEGLQLQVFREEHEAIAWLNED